MKDRIAQFMKTEGLTAMKFAEIMEVRPSNVSHIISGRSNPGFEFIARFMQRFPEVSPDWLINGIGEMYRSEGLLNSTERVTLSEDEAIDSPQVSTEGQIPVNEYNALADVELINMTSATIKEDVGVENDAFTNVNTGDDSLSHSSHYSEMNPLVQNNDGVVHSHEGKTFALKSESSAEMPSQNEYIEKNEIQGTDSSSTPLKAEEASASILPQPNCPSVMPIMLGDGDTPQQIIFFYADNTYKVFKSR